MSILEFLDARISEDETRIQYAPKYSDPYDGDLIPLREDVRTRLLAECAAKRGVLMSYQSCVYAEDKADGTSEIAVKLVSAGMVKGLELAIKALAAVHASHPSYDQGWAIR